MLPVTHRGGTHEVRPLRDWVLVKRIEEEEQRIGPRYSEGKPRHPTVVALGSGRVNDDGKAIPLDVQAWEYVLVGKYAGTAIKLDGEDHLIIREAEILAVAEGVSELEAVSELGAYAGKNLV